MTTGKPSDSCLPRPGETFREAVKAEAERLWRLQWMGLVVLLGPFALLPLCPGSLLPWLQVVWLLAIAGFSYAFYRGSVRVQCPVCCKRLAYLLEDKRMGSMRGTSVSGIPRGPISRKGLPDDLYSCPYCGHPFDTMLEELTNAEKA